MLLAVVALLVLFLEVVFTSGSNPEYPEIRNGLKTCAYTRIRSNPTFPSIFLSTLYPRLMVRTLAKSPFSKKRVEAIFAWLSDRYCLGTSVTCPGVVQRLSITE